MVSGLVLLIGLILAFANGANDNFKGVATIYGSRVARYGTALAWATITTLAGAILSFLVARGLIQAFSGRGIVDAAVMAHARFPAVVALAASLTVLAASRLGMPISTTHAIAGSLAGVAMVACAGWGWLAALGVAFLLPLVVSPVASLSLSWIATQFAPARADACVCVADAATASGGTVPVALTGTEKDCAAAGATPVVRTSRVLSAFHFVSAGAVGFMRGTNDTPKLMGVVAAAGVAADFSLAVIFALAMALGGLVGARRVARTMSEQLTPMSPAQGTVANMLTSGIVGAASVCGLPVSTTHVSCGAIFGLGAARKELSLKWAGAVAGSWLFTLPVSAVSAVALWFALAFLD